MPINVTHKYINVMLKTIPKPPEFLPASFAEQRELPRVHLHKISANSMMRKLCFCAIRENSRVWRVGLRFVKKYKVLLMNFVSKF